MSQRTNRHKRVSPREFYSFHLLYRQDSIPYNIWYWFGRFSYIKKKLKKTD